MIRKLLKYKLPLSNSLAVGGMILAILGVYWSVPEGPDSILVGLDYGQLHVRRMQFAREALFSATHTLPGWYPRELLGTPFWSNAQNFPFVPTRLVTLLTMDPAGPYTYWVAVVMSALLAASFTYLYLRKLGLGVVASAAGGWTFACNGFYAARIAAGHLPLLEAYPALPLLMWVSESLFQADERPHVWLGALALSSACVLLVGHPQLSAYALVVCSFYLAIRGGLRIALRYLPFILLGGGIASFVLIPMALLISRSSRVLPLALPNNDVAMPYKRLLAFFSPWRDGAPPPLGRANISFFEGYPNWAYFWETVSYAGLLPWIALGLLGYLVIKGDLPSSQRTASKFMMMLATAGIVLSLPFVHATMSLIPATIFRSPARYIYLTEFALAAALAFAVHTGIGRTRTRLGQCLLAVILMLHVWDVANHSHEFIMRDRSSSQPKIFDHVLRNVGDGRVAMDYFIVTPENRMVDDVGFFDSIMLARTYRMLLSIAQLPTDLNTQFFNGSEMSARALAMTGVKKVITFSERHDLSEGQKLGKFLIYDVPQPFARAEFFSVDQTQQLSTEQIHDVLRNGNVELSGLLLLPSPRPTAHFVNGASTSNESSEIEYRRPNSDRIEVTVATRSQGYVRVIESWDPGWSATIDGSPVPALAAMDGLLAAPVTAGRHEIAFVYQTPGAAVGGAVSIVSIVILVFMLSRVRRSKTLYAEYTMP